MYPKFHLISGTIFSIILFLIVKPLITPLGVIVIIASSVLIDVDHYLYYGFKKKDWSLKNAYKWFVKKDKIVWALPRKKRNEVRPELCILHGVEILLVLLLFGIFYFKFLLLVLVGFSFHLLVDLIGDISYNDRLDKVSVIWDFFKNKKLRPLDS